MWEDEAHAMINNIITPITPIIGLNPTNICSSLSHEGLVLNIKGNQGLHLRCSVVHLSKNNQSTPKYLLINNSALAIRSTLQIHPYYDGPDSLDDLDQVLNGVRHPEVSILIITHLGLSPKSEFMFISDQIKVRNTMTNLGGMIPPIMTFF